MSWKNILLVMTLSVLLVSCDTKHLVPDDPRPIPQRPHPEEVRLAVVLGGGGARGMAHIGVLEVFEEEGIQIDLLVGCSAGSIVGALYADRPNAAYIREVLKPVKKWDILDINLWYCRYGFVQGWSLRRFLNRELSCKTFEQLQIPLYVVATDVLEGELVWFNSGPIIPAVHASAAVPLVFSPVVFCDRVLVDGGVADPIPVETAKLTGAKIVVAIDLSELLSKTCPKHLFGVAARSAEIKFLLQSESCANGADVIIRPKLDGIGMFDDTNYDLVYEAGRKAAVDAMPRIKQLLEN